MKDNKCSLDTEENDTGFLFNLFALQEFNKTGIWTLLKLKRRLSGRVAP